MKKIFIVIFIILPIRIFSFNFETVIENIDKTNDISTSLLEIEKLKREINILKSPDDASLSLSPSFKTISPVDDNLIDDLNISGTISAKIPTGLSKLEREKLLFLENTYELEINNLENIKFSTYVKLYKLYKELWLLQVEEDVIKMELEASIKYYEVIYNRFLSGAVTLQALNDAIEEKQQRESDYSKNSLEKRLAWFELMFNIDIVLEPEDVEKVNIEISEIPTPNKLLDWIKENNQEIITEQIKLTQLDITKDRLNDMDLDVSIKPFYNADKNEFSTSLNYNLMNKELSPSFTVNSTNNSSTWNAGVSFNISIGTNNNDSLSGKSIKIDIDLAQNKLNYMIESLNLNLKTAYQKFILSKEELSQAERNLDSTMDRHELILTKVDLGQLSEFDLLESKAIIERNKWKLYSAEKDYELAWLLILEISEWYKTLDITKFTL